MNTLLQTRAVEIEERRSATGLDRASFFVRLNKVICAILLGVCFWFSVPYYLPLKVDPDPVKAAQNEAHAYEGNVSRQVAMPIIFCIAAWMLWRLQHRGRMDKRLTIIALLYVGWAILSVLWSEDPTITRKRLVVFAINAFFAWTVARIFSVLEMSLWGFVATGTVALISFYVDTVQEKIFAPFDPDYRFTGVMTANYQAMNLLVCIVCALTLVQRRPRWWPWISVCVVAALTLMYLTRARLSAAICLLLIAILLARFLKERLLPQTRAIVILAGLAVVAPALIFVLGRNGGGAAQSAFMMGRTDTQNTSNLSNRAPLWSELMESVDDQPWLGFGYEAFWTPARVERVSADQGWMVPHAHNTYLDQWLSLGAIGALLYIAMIWGATWIAWSRYRRDRSESTLYPAVLLTWLALTGVAESVPLDPYLPTMLAYACVAKMCLVEGSEAKSDAGLQDDEIVGGLMPEVAG